MKFDTGKLLLFLGATMAAVENISKATGAEKEAAVIQAINDLVPALEGFTGVDFVNDEALHALLVDVIETQVALMNAIAHAKQLKPKPPTA